MLDIFILWAIVIMPFIWALIHNIIINNKQKIKIYVNYFIGVNIMFYMLFNGFTYTFNSDYIAKYQNWHDSLAVVELGIIFFSIGITGFISLFKSCDFKKAVLYLYAITLFLNIIFTFVSQNLNTLEYNYLASNVVKILIISFFIKFYNDNKIKTNKNI